MLFLGVLLGLAAPPAYNLSMDLDPRFVRGYYRKVTLTSQFRVFAVKNSVNPASADGEIHVAGWGDAAGRPLGFATVAEIWKAKHLPDVVALLRGHAQTGDPVRVAGAWRLWAEHAGGEATFTQGQMADTSTWAHPSNPDHIFEIHPVTSVGSGPGKIDLRPTFTFLSGFPQSTAPARARTYFPRFENAQCRITLQGDRLLYKTNVIAINFIGFWAEPIEPAVSTGDGWRIHARIRTLDVGEVVSEDTMLVFPAGVPAAAGFQSGVIPPPMKLVGIARFGLAKARLVLATAQPYEGKLDYEMIVFTTQP